jgi:hypothetical protein
MCGVCFVRLRKSAQILDFSDENVDLSLNSYCHILHLRLRHTRPDRDLHTCFDFMEHPADAVSRHLLCRRLLLCEQLPTQPVILVVRGDESIDVHFEAVFDFVEGDNPTVDERVDSLLCVFQIIRHLRTLQQSFLEALHADHAMIVMWAVTAACVGAAHAGIGRAACLKADAEDGRVACTARECGEVRVCAEDHN